MSLRWDFEKDFIGVIKFIHRDREDTDVTCNMYSGNALMIACAETDKTYAVFAFFADEYHAKNCLGLAKGTEDIYDQYDIELYISDNKNALNIANLFMKCKTKRSLKIIKEKEIRKCL